MSKPSEDSILLGHVDVDAGLVFLGDPCHLTDEQNPFRSWDKFVHDFAAALDKKDTPAIVIDQGVIVDGFGGDGTYPVFAELDAQGKVRRVIIDFEVLEEA